MYSPQDLENILFLDIETASIVPTYAELSPRMQALWASKAQRYQRQEPEKTAEELYPEKAAIHAEFGQVVCISCGYLRFGEDKLPQLTVKSFYGPDELRTLEAFGPVLDKFTSKGMQVCAHNGKEFDFPYLGRRFVIRGLPIPEVLQVQGKKPWQTAFIDTMELWKFGDFKAYTSLDLLAAVLDIPSPKDDIDGSQVGRVFWEEQGYDRIRIYCEKDVQTTAQVLLRMSRLPLIPV
ncbi:MAG: 3'-5' exonuclease [Bacteroidetes bacterium]|nr:MAG: 3'-5' exonuclease [Bacteroidota bacterium]